MADPTDDRTTDDDDAATGPEHPIADQQEALIDAVENERAEGSPAAGG